MSNYAKKLVTGDSPDRELPDITTVPAKSCMPVLPSPSPPESVPTNPPAGNNTNQSCLNRNIQPYLGKVKSTVWNTPEEGMKRPSKVPTRFCDDSSEMSTLVNDGKEVLENDVNPTTHLQIDGPDKIRYQISFTAAGDRTEQHFLP